MKKKLIALLAAAMMVLFGMASMASAEPGPNCESASGDPCDFTCYTQGKTGGPWTIGDIPIQYCSTVQGQEKLTIPAFDFEWASSGWRGYCDGTHTFKTLIYSLCCCEASTIDYLNPEEHADLPVKFVVEILTDGVYFGDTNLSRGEATAANFEGPFARFRQYYDMNEVCAAATAGQIWGDAVGYNYWVMPAEAVSGVGPDETAGLDVTRLVDIDADANFFCTSATDGKYKELQYNKDISTNAYLTVGNLWTIKADGSYDTRSSFLAWDLPSFAYDNTVVKNNDAVQVRVSAQVYIQDPNCSVCGKIWQTVCSCTKTIGTFVDDCGGTPAVYKDKCFPYVTGPDFGDNWWTGIALSNMSGEAQTYTVKAFIEGKSASFTIDVAANTVKTFMLSDYRAALSGLDLTKNGYVEISCESGSFDGFAMVGDQTQAMGYLPRCGECGTCN